MSAGLLAARLVEQEIDGLLSRLDMLKPFALHETMVPAAIPADGTLRIIDGQLLAGRRALARAAREFVRWLRALPQERLHPACLYRRYVLLRLRFNAVLTQFDLFSDAVTQRSESETGVWLGGLDALARDALRIDQAPYRLPPVLCYLDRGVGAAIRRARTRLPGGGENPVAVIRVPRERMVGLGIASSLVHEAGHQGAALLDLLPALRRGLELPIAADASPYNPWPVWNRWISEIVADLWSVSRLGVASTMGLMNVVSLPPPFVFRTNLDDPHPTPWLRVLLSIEMGRQLYPHPQWQRLAGLWRSLYPVPPEPERVQELGRLMTHIPTFVAWLLNTCPPALGGRTLGAALANRAVQPSALEDALERWRRDEDALRRVRPTEAFAIAGYAKLNRGRLPKCESVLFKELLTGWALTAG